MTVSIYNAMERGADSQVSGVIGTLQGAIAQINTPELMFLFSGDDFSLDVNDLEKPRDFDPFGHAGFAHLWLQYD